MFGKIETAGAFLKGWENALAGKASPFMDDPDGEGPDPRYEGERAYWRKAYHCGVQAARKAIAMRDAEMQDAIKRLAA